MLENFITMAEAPVMGDTAPITTCLIVVGVAAVILAVMAVISKKKK